MAGLKLNTPCSKYTGFSVNIDIFACIHFRQFMKKGNFTCIKIRVLGYCKKKFSKCTYFRGYLRITRILYKNENHPLEFLAVFFGICLSNHKKRRGETTKTAVFEVRDRRDERVKYLTCSRAGCECVVGEGLADPHPRFLYSPQSPHP